MAAFQLVFLRRIQILICFTFGLGVGFLVTSISRGAPLTQIGLNSDHWSLGQGQMFSRWRAMHGHPGGREDLHEQFETDLARHQVGEVKFEDGHLHHGE